VVTLDGAPERLFVRRDGDDPRLQAGARLAGVVASLEPALSMAFLDLGRGAEAILQFKPEAKPARGEVVEVEIRGEPRRGKLAVARLLGAAEGPPRLLAEAPGFAVTLKALVPGATLVTGAPARVMADEAEAEALEVLHALPGGGTLAIEPTRALTAVDVDLGQRKGGDSKRVTRAANLAAIAKRGLTARLQRPKRRGKPMPSNIRRGNATRGKVRAAVEHVFACQKQRLRLVVRTVGLARATTKLGLANLAYNLLRFVWLDGRTAPA